jgi:hypothetical protein
VHLFLAGRAKTKRGKDAGSVHAVGMHATEDAATRRFAAGRVDKRMCGRDR